MKPYIKKLMNRRELRQKILHQLPSYFNNTDIVGYQEEFFKGLNDTVDVGIALIKKDGSHLTVVLSNIYNLYEETGDDSIVKSFCAELRRNYTDTIYSSIDALKSKISTASLAESICCIALDTQKNESILSNSIHEERGPFSVVLRQFAIDSYGHAIITEIHPEEIETDEELRKMDLHSIIEKAIRNTAVNFRVESQSMAQMVANSTVNQLVDNGLLPDTQEFFQYSFDIIASKLESKLPRIYRISNGTPYGTVAMFYPGFFANFCKKLNTNTLTILPRTVEEIFILADKWEDHNSVIESIDALWDIKKRSSQLSEKAFIYDAGSDTINFNIK